MSSVDFVNLSDQKMPKKFVSQWLQLLKRKLRQKRAKNLGLLKLPVSLVFLNQGSARQLNSRYRRKNYATDVLSFSDGIYSLGELVLCPQVIKKQSLEHRMSYREELSYLLTHGILHLLGYEHEKSRANAKKMFSLQDRVWQEIWSELK